MNILLVEPFFAGSHQKWAEGYRRHSRHQIEILSMKGRHWKWRMYGGAVSLAEKWPVPDFRPDLLLATDMLDLTTFLALTRSKSRDVPVAIYFHENQINYPWSEADADVRLQRNNQYGFINYTSALAADAVFFNSHYHRDAFLDRLPGFLKQFPDGRELHNADIIRKKSTVLPLGLGLSSMKIAFQQKTKPGAPTLLWNHRWEYDKDPESFFDVLDALRSGGARFRLIVLGASFAQWPPVFKEAEKKFSEEIIHFGFVKNEEHYYRLLLAADILPVTSRQDFFGASTVEAIYAGCHPLLPDRLAYPEHIPPTFRKDHLYKDNTELLHKLRYLLQHPGKIHYYPFQNFVSHYDWSILASVYDETMEKVMSND